MFPGCSKRRRISIQNDSAPAIRNKDSPPDAAASCKPVFVPLLPSKEKRLSPAFLPMLHPKVSEMKETAYPKTMYEYSYNLLALFALAEDHRKFY